MASGQKQMGSAEYIESALHLLAMAGVDDTQLDYLRQEANKILNQPSSDEARLSQFVDSISIILTKVGKALISRGFSVAHNGALYQAEQYLKLGLMIGELQSDNSLLAHGLLGMGLVYKKRSDLLSAEKCYLQVLPIMDKIGDIEGKSATLDNLGNVYMAMGQDEQALECYNRALNAAHEAGDLQGELAVLGNISGVYQKRGELIRAKEILKQVIEQAHSIEEFDQEALSLDNLAMILMMESNLGEAEQYQLRALELFSRLDMAYDKYMALKNLSGLYMHMGKTALAGSYYEQAADLIRNLRSSIDINRYTVARKQAIRRLEHEGHIRRERLQRSLLEARRKDRAADHREEWPLLRAVGILLGERHHLSGSEKLERHQYEDAERDLKLALTAFRKEGAYARMVGVLSDLGGLYLEIGNPKRSLEYLLQARKLASEMGDLIREVNILCNLSRFASDYGEAGYSDLDDLDLLTQAELLLELWPRVVEWYKQEDVRTKHVKEDQDTETKNDTLMTHLDTDYGAAIYNNLGNRHVDHGSYVRAERYFLKAIEIAKKDWKKDSPDSFRLIYRFLNLFRLYRLTNQNEKLQQVLEQIKNLAAQSKDPQGEFVATTILGEYYWHAEENLGKAYQMFKRAIELSDILREQIPHGEERIRYIGHTSPPFHSAALLAVQLGLTNEAFDLVNRSKSRQMLESLSETLPRPFVNDITETLLDKERDLFAHWLKAVQILKDFVPDKPDRPFLELIFRASKEVEKTQDELDKIWSEIEQIYPEYVSLRRGTPLNFTHVLRILSEQ